MVVNDRCIDTVLVATSNIPLSSPDHTRITPARSGTLQPVPASPQSKIDSLKTWSFNTYKFTRQMLSERLGRGSKTVDADLEAQIELLRDTQLKYANILRLAQALSNHFRQMTQTQQLLSDAFNDLSQKNPELREEFLYNSETQRVLYKNGETLLGKRQCSRRLLLLMHIFFVIKLDSSRKYF